MRDVAVHHGSLPAGDTCSVDGIPCTTPARTLVDCAAVVALETLCAMVDTAFHRGLCHPSNVRAAAVRASRAPGRKGLRNLEAAMSVWTSGARPGSPAEARPLRCLERWGIPTPQRQYVVRDADGNFVARLDFAWPGRKRGLEYDGEEHHGPRRWAADEERQARIESLGWKIERADRFDLRPSSTRLRTALRALLA